MFVLSSSKVEDLIRNDASKLEKELKEELETRIGGIQTQIQTEKAVRETKLSEIETKSMEDYSTMQAKMETIEEYFNMQRQDSNNAN